MLPHWDDMTVLSADWTASLLALYGIVEKPVIPATARPNVPPT